MGQPRTASPDPVTEWEERVGSQFAALKKFAAGRRCALKESDLPPRDFGKSGREHEVYHVPHAPRLWKATYAGQSGFGHFGYYTPGGYLRRLRLSNIIFGDDVEFEGMWTRKEGLSIVTSQSYIHPLTPTTGTSSGRRTNPWWPLTCSRG